MEVETVSNIGLLSTEDNEVIPLFRTEVLLRDEILVIMPSKNSFEKRVEKVITGFFDAIKIKRLLKKKEFEEYLEPVLNDRGEEVVLGDGPDVKLWITREESYEDLVKAIRETLSAAFRDVETYANTFDHLKNIFIENKRVNIEQLQNGDYPLDFFRNEMQKYKQQNELVEKMRTSKYKGIFFVDTSKLKQLFLPSPNSCLQAIHQVLPVLAREKNIALYRDLRNAVTKLQSPPSSVEEFVAYLQFVDKISADLENIEARFKNVSEIYKLMEDEKVNVPLKDKDEFSNGTVQTISTLRTSISLAEESKEDRINKFSVDLDRKFEDLRAEVQDIQQKSRDPMINDVHADVPTVIKYLTDLKNSMDDAARRSKELANYQEMFKITPESIDEIEQAEHEVHLKLKLWSSLQQWTDLVHDWRTTMFENIVTDTIKSQIDYYTLICLQVQKEINDNPVVPKLNKMVDEWRNILPVITDLKNNALKPRHWRLLDGIIDRNLSNENGKFELSVLFELNVLDPEKRRGIEEISQQASNEASLEELLKTIKDHWDTTTFDIVSHKEVMNIIGSVDDIITQLEDDRITVSTILSSRYVAAIKQQVEKWEEELKLIHDTIKEMITCQRKWLYLESVFSAPDIQSELKDDHKLFTSVDRFFKETMKKASESKLVHLLITNTPGIYDKFKQHNGHLEKIEKSLEDYLQEKRNAFARFYFLSNDDLLDILSKTKDPQAVQPHLQKCFEGIKSLQIEPTGAIKAMISREGEKVTFTSTTMKARPIVHEWLKEVEDNMVRTLKELTKQGVKDYENMPRDEFIKTTVAQVVWTVNQIFWCREVTRCLTSANPIKEMQMFLETSKHQLNELAAMTRSELTSTQRKVIQTLIIIEVHARDVVEQMIADGVSSVTDFGWLKQLRYYWENNCMVRQSNSEFTYGFEYGGIQSRLVITPLTDRVYMTLTGALHMKLGGSPSGPAGTGKTETVKDLAKALALQCVVYNCSEGVTYNMMTKFFSGIVQTGAWACFDEFNRINVEVLSVIATQLLLIQNALKANDASMFCLEDDKPLKIIKTCGVFITMNPGYAGRTELPDNLKALFRPVAVMMPDYRLIAEVTLFSEGYEKAKDLSRKMTQLYKLSNEQLSSQDHYDFGMRAMKSVLVMAGELKRANPDVQEEITLMRAMRDSNIPKFVKEDVSLFEAIVSDLFPNVCVPKQDYGELMIMLEKKITQEFNLQIVPCFVNKIIQLYDTLIVRHGVMLVGPTGGGKTSARDVLASSMNALSKEKTKTPFHAVQQYALNPKSITYGELYGVLDVNTTEWFDGLIPYFVRKAVRDTSADRKWLVFDGPVDTLWIESMNSVLDDSKLLCLDNAERIQLNDKISFVFEVQDLSVASPATVSRCGMVYIDPEDLGWAPFVKSWILKLHLLTSHKEFVQTLFDEYITNSLLFIRNHCKEDVETVDLALVTCLCDLFVAVMPNHAQLTGREDPYMKTMLQNLFTFSFVWSIGGNIVKENRQEFDKHCRDQLRNVCNMPLHGSVYDFCIDFDTNTFVEWSRMVPEFVYNPSIPFSQIMVPTVDTVRSSYMLRTLIKIEKPILFNGKTGVGKTSIVANTLAQDAESMGLELITIQFSAQTNSSRTQEMIETKLVPRKGVLRAPPGKKVVLFIDDLNMPQLEQFGAQPPIELLRQLLSYNGFYDVKDRANFPWKRVEDVTVVAACGPPGGGRNPTTPRLLRLFHVLNVPDLSEDSMFRIFHCILSGFLTNFNEEIQSVSKTLVKIAVDLFNRTLDQFKPIPACAHYTFNLRDLSKVFQGMLQVKPEAIKTIHGITKLWVHESMRSFHDRLINHTDRSHFADIVIELLRRYFKGVSNWSSEDLFGSKPVMFGSILNKDRYEEMPNIEMLPPALDEQLMLYNMEHSGAELDLVFFPDAAKHVSRIVRIISQPKGNALLVGVGGCGKQSLTRLAAFIAGFSTFEICLKKGYKLSDFRTDLQNLMRKAGVEGAPVLFLFSDSQIIDETFLEDINNLLNSGEVPNLFAQEDKDKIINELRPAAAEANINNSRDLIYDFFIQRVKSNLHIVLCMSPVGDAFRNRIRMFPSLVNCCTIDWFDEWPKEALKSVAERKFNKINVGSDQTKQSLIELAVYIHGSAAEITQRFLNEFKRHYYITPASYLSFIIFYEELLEKKRHELNESRDRLAKGLDILRSTNQTVDEMQKELESLQPVLKQKSIDVERIMREVAKGQQEAKDKRERIAQEEQIVSEKAKKADAIAREAAEKLADVEPTLEAAKKALDSVSKAEIAEIKKYNEPKEPVKVTLAAVLTLFNEKDTSWQNAKIIMSGADFVSRCKEFNLKDLNQRTVDKLKKDYVNTKNVHFQPSTVASTSLAAGSLCQWVRAMVSYFEVTRLVEPLHESLKKAKSDLDEMELILKAKQEELRVVEENLVTLNIHMKDTNDEAVELQQKTEQSERRLKTAQKLTVSLADEYNRWTLSVAELDKQISNLPGNIFLASAMIVYYGAFVASYRKELFEEWSHAIREKGVSLSEDCNIEKVVSDAVQIRDWNIEGLPTDLQSIQNAILVTLSRRWPLLIDPQGQANMWIKKLEKPNGLKVLKQSDSNYGKILEGAIRIGTPVLMEDVSEVIDPSLEPVLSKQVFRSQGRLVIKMGTSLVDYNPKFRFYMTTKLANPHYLPDICNKVTLINFTVTAKGLEDQLLGDVVRKLKKELEEEKDSLVLRVAEDSKTLSEVEALILNSLSKTSGTSILDDTVIIEQLDNSKFTANMVIKRVQQTEIAEKSLNQSREQFRSIAIRGSILYFVMADLAKIDPMYQYSLEYFKKLFNKCIDVTASDNIGVSQDQLLIELTNNITDSVYNNVCRGLFEKDKGIFSFLICTQILRNSGDITEIEWALLTRDASTLMVGAGTAIDNNVLAPWLNEQQWILLCLIDHYKIIPKFVDDVMLERNAWENFFADPEAFKKPLPLDYDSKIKPFHRLLLLKCFCEEKLLFGVTEFVRTELGDQFTRSPALDLDLALRDASASTPIVFILSQGADPTDMLQKFAANMKINLEIRSLGQGQDVVAKRLIEKGRKNERTWVLLQNCHLYVSFMPELEKIIAEFSSPTAVLAPDFRLWLTSMPSKDFPIPILQNSVKLTNEPPKGIQANLTRTYRAIEPSYIERFDVGNNHSMDNADSTTTPNTVVDADEDHPQPSQPAINKPIQEEMFPECSKALAFKKLLFGLSLFHATIQERKKFGPLGWTIQYEFNDSDLSVAQQWLKMFLEEQSTIPWDSLKYVIGEIVYGGRVTDPWDRRTLISILQRYFESDILKQDFSFAPSDTGAYTIPHGGSQGDYIKFIECLPYNDDPSIFSMHENANIVFQMQETSRMMGTVVSVQPRAATGASKGGGGNVASDQDVVSGIVQKILAQLPALLDKSEAGPTTFTRLENGSMHSLSTVLSHEMLRFNRLLIVMRSTLEELVKAIAGLVILSAELEKMFVSLLNNQVPELWAEVAYPSLKPLGLWIEDLKKRVLFMRNWLKNGVPSSYWISGFFFPQGFMTGVLQTFARRYKEPIDELSFRFVVLDPDAVDVEQAPEDGVYVYGMYMDGARWDAVKRTVIEANPGEMNSPLPMVHFLPEKNHKVADDVYECPLYKTSVRKGTLSSLGQSTNFVIAVELPTDKPPTHWVLQGAALLCQLDN
ncbi:dynein heavy chain [Acrasis kona]|uniref:Dynein heavy chain n=1 Tax=Acrasis kona TaxID=1008807 RepID=A0AAW2ZGM2_9EUKA